MEFNIIPTQFRESLLGLCAAAFISIGALSCGFHAPTSAEDYDPETHPEHKIDLTSPEAVTELYQIMKDTHEVFTRCQLPYWADSGTTLGAIRNQGIIPWDDDNDTAILSSDAPKLLILRQIFSDLGYFIEKVFFGYRIVKNGTTAQVDIFLLNESYGTYTYDQGDWGSRLKTDPNTGETQKVPIFLTHDELFPPREVDFGPIKVMVPNNPTPYLDAMFKGWNQVAFTYGHAGQKKFKIDLNKYSIFRQPAPLDPQTLKTQDIRHLMKNRVPMDLKCPSIGNNPQNIPMPVLFDGV